MIRSAHFEPHLGHVTSSVADRSVTLSDLTLEICSGVMMVAHDGLRDLMLVSQSVSRPTQVGGGGKLILAQVLEWCVPSSLTRSTTPTVPCSCCNRISDVACMTLLIECPRLTVPSSWWSKAICP